MAMGQYSIKEVETLSGIKAHTLRIWEQRYEIVIPERTDTNIRFYTDNQLKKILNLAFLNRNGFKISKLVGLSDSDIALRMEEVSKKDSPYDYYINNMITAMIALNEEDFNKAIAESLRTYSFEKFCKDIIFPFLKRTGMLWATGGITPAQEHFASNLIKRRIIIATDALGPVLNPKAKKFLLFLPEGEYHELSLLISQYILKSFGHQVYYFGSSLPLNDLKEVTNRVSIDYILTLIIYTSDAERIQKTIDSIKQSIPNQTLLFAGNRPIYDEIDFGENTILVKTLDDFIEFSKDL